MSPRCVFLFTVACVTLALLQSSTGAFINLKVYENDWLKKILSDPLNNVVVRPTILNTSEPIEISVSLQVVSFDGIDINKQEFSVQLILRQEWEDDRLAYAKFNPVQLRQLKYLTLLETDKVWRPDTYFKNEKSSSLHENMKPNNFARIFANGTVILDTRISVTLSCPVNLRYFPFESITCAVQLASYAFSRDDLIYKWKPTLPSPISVPHLPAPPSGYVFDSVTSNYCDTGAVIGGPVSCLLAEFHFHRSSSHYLKQDFVPLLNLVIVGWTSFLLDPRREGTLLLRGILTLVALSLAYTLCTRIGASVPPTPYSTALDFWNGISLTFIFSAFLELMVVLYLIQTRKEPTTPTPGVGGSSTLSSKRNSAFEEGGLEMSPRSKLGLEGVTSVNIEPENQEEMGGGERKKSVGSGGGVAGFGSNWREKANPDKIEKWAKVLYPGLWVGFNLIFWVVCSNSGDH